MPKKLYALLVGINDYAPEVGRLSGCINDVEHFRDYLNANFNKKDLAVEVLKDSEATRENIIKLFRSHLGKARSEDVALFQYSGHGARWSAAREFKAFYPEGKDEGLVCYDSRRENGVYPFDLADKELAALLSEVAANNPHLAVILDCCHSGSGSRGADDFTHLKARFTPNVPGERPLDSYLDGYYLKRKRQNEPLHIPAGRHILLAACERRQKAWETREHSGVFTDTLLEVLNASGGNLSYADLFARCRAAVRKRAENQDPQFETSGDFNAWAGFLGREASRKPLPHSVYFEGGVWKVDAGALHGFPTEPEKKVGLALYPESDPSRLAGNASTTVVGAQKSDLELSFASDHSVRYRGEITSLPAAPIPIFLEAGQYRQLLEQTLKDDPSICAIFTNNPGGTRYALLVEDEKLLLKQRETDLFIQGVEINPQNPQASAATMLSVLKHVIQWEKSLALQNQATQMDTSLVDFIFSEVLDDGSEHEYSGNEIILDYLPSGSEEKEIRGRFKVRNRSRQELHLIFAYFSSAYGITIFSNEPVPPTGEYVTLPLGDSPDAGFYLEDGENENVDHFKLIVSTERVDDFLLRQEDLELGKILTPRTLRHARPIDSRKKYQNEWFTKNISVKVVRQVSEVSDRDVSLAGGKIVVKGHANLKANLSLSAAKSLTRGVVDGSDFYKVLEQHGLELLNFAAARGESAGVLELNDIRNAESLAENPLKIELNHPLKDDEGILPLVFDGEHILPAGDPFKDEAGNTHISIAHLPELPPDNRRSPGKALKLYFFKTYLKQETNQLCWVEFKAGGSIERHSGMLANKAAAAQNILLLIHGLMGDSEILAKSLLLARDEQERSLHQKFDLVLSYDYENLSTPIAETALKLKKQLEAAGLGENDGKQLTILSHSLGGLAARWFIEKEGGNRMVDHLVMCGTPNNGSPFGKVDNARKILNTLLALSFNYFPALIPYGSAAIFLLNRSKKITPTLEQMDPASPFIRELNGSGDPGVRYTILAGDIDEFKEPSGENLFEKLLSKLGKGVVFDLLFGPKAHDLAVSVESILGVNGARTPAPLRKNLACHHLNYFESEAGLQGLREVEW